MLAAAITNFEYLTLTFDPLAFTWVILFALKNYVGGFNMSAPFDDNLIGTGNDKGENDLT